MFSKQIKAIITMLIIVQSINLSHSKDILPFDPNIKPIIFNSIIDANSQYRVPNRYIITYKEDLITDNISDQTKILVQEITQSLASISNSQILHEYHTAIYGSALFNTNQNAIFQLYSDPNVDKIYADTYATASTNQYDASYHLDRVDQQNFPLDTVYNYSNQGTGVEVFVIDSGILASHDEFGGRVQTQMDFTDDEGTNENMDGQDHGTGVASVIGGNQFGIAKNVTIHSLKVGKHNSDVFSWTSIISALEHIIEDLNNNPRTILPIVNMSFGTEDGSVNEVAESYYRTLFEENRVILISASGNEGNSFCGFPASSDYVLSVGGTDHENNQRWVDSNYGSCVDIYAPAAQIYSASSSGNSDSKTSYGTSSAAPAVAGAAALYLQGHPTANHHEVKSAILNAATRNIILKPYSTSQLIPANENYFLNVSPLMPYSEIVYPDIYENDDDMILFYTYSGSKEYRDFLDDKKDIVDFEISSSQQCYVEFTNLGSNTDICVNRLQHIGNDDTIGVPQVCGFNNSNPDNRLDLISPNLRWYIKNDVSGPNTEYAIEMQCQEPDVYENDDSVSIIRENPFDHELPFFGSVTQSRNFVDDSQDWLLFSTLAIACGGGKDQKNSCKFNFSDIGSSNNLCLELETGSKFCNIQPNTEYRLIRPHKGAPLLIRNLGTVGSNTEYMVDIECGCF